MFGKEKKPIAGFIFFFCRVGIVFVWVDKFNLRKRERKVKCSVFPPLWWKFTKLQYPLNQHRQLLDVLKVGRGQSVIDFLVEERTCKHTKKIYRFLLYSFSMEITKKDSNKRVKDTMKMFDKVWKLYFFTLGRIFFLNMLMPQLCNLVASEVQTCL